MRRCFFCNGNIDELRNVCIMCGRTTDVKHELYAEEERRKEHNNWYNLYKYKGNFGKRKLKKAEEEI